MSIKSKPKQRTDILIIFNPAKNYQQKRQSSSTTTKRSQDMYKAKQIISLPSLPPQNNVQTNSQ